MAFARLLAQIIMLKEKLLDYRKKNRLGNDGEFTSQAYNDYCLSTAITVEHPVAHVHTLNDLPKSLIKYL